MQYRAAFFMAGFPTETVIVGVAAISNIQRNVQYCGGILNDRSFLAIAVNIFSSYGRVEFHDGPGSLVAYCCR